MCYVAIRHYTFVKCVAAERTDCSFVFPNVGLFIKPVRTVPSSAMYKKQLCKYVYFIVFPLKYESVCFNVAKKTHPGAAE